MRACWYKRMTTTRQYDCKGAMVDNGSDTVRRLECQSKGRNVRISATMSAIEPFHRSIPAY